MKVGIVLPDFAPDAGGGYTIQDDIVRALLELADDSRHTFVLFCKSNGAFGSSPSSRVQMVPYLAPNLFDRAAERATRESATFRMLWPRPGRLERMARARAVEFMWLMDTFPVFMDLPYLALVLDLQHRRQPMFPEVSAGGIWDRREAAHSWFLQRASIIVAGTQAGKEEIERFYQVPPERIKLLAHPTPAFALAAPHSGREALEKYGIPDNYLFYPAQFWPHKNHANLLYAVRTLRDDRRLSLPVVFIGSDQGNAAHIKRLAGELDLERQVRFLGFVSREELVSLYRNALALTYVTFFGPENLPPLEAFALGCPVIASNVAGAQEQLGDAALLVDPRSPDEMAAAIKRIHDDKALRDLMVCRGLKRASSWTSRDFVRGMFAILDDFEPVRRCWA